MVPPIAEPPTDPYVRIFIPFWTIGLDTRDLMAVKMGPMASL